MTALERIFAAVYVRAAEQLGKTGCQIISLAGAVLGVGWFRWWFLLPAMLMAVGNGLATAHDMGKLRETNMEL